MSRSRRTESDPAPAVRAAPPPAKRRSQAERSEATRERLMEATAELLLKRGYGGLRTQEISELAGVSRGAQLHHFPNKDALVIATMAYLNQAMLAASRQRARAARESGDTLEQIIADAFDFFFGDYFFITLAIGVSDERNEALRRGVMPYMGPSRFEIEREWQAVLETSGLPRQLAADVLALTLSLVRGFSVRKLIDDDHERFVQLMDLWRRIVGDFIRSELTAVSANDA